MKKRFLLIFSLVAVLLTGQYLHEESVIAQQAQTCATRPITDDSNACATTAFVHNLIGSGAGTVTSVFGRTGAVVAALGDYTASLIPYTPAGPNATTTQLQTRTTNAPLNFVADYGANPYDSIDVTTLLLNAISDQQTSGRCLYVPRGLYRLTAKIEVITTGFESNPICMYGDGRTNTTPVTNTFTNGSSTIAGVGLPTVTNTVVVFKTTGSLPTNFATGTPYYIRSGSTSTAMTVAATPGGAAIVAGSAGSGTHTVRPVSGTTLYWDTTYTADDAFYMHGADNSIQVFGRIEHMSFIAGTDGATVKIGKDNKLDAFNEFELNDVYIDNYRTAAPQTAIALRLNFWVNGKVNAVLQGGAANKGYAALHCQQCLFSSFFGSYGISNIGALFAGGSNYGNAFYNVDHEAASTNIMLFDSGAVSNTWYSGTCSDGSGIPGLSVTCINGVAGSGNIMYNTYMNPTLAYRVSPGSVGIRMVTPNDNLVATPAVPATGTVITNTYSQTAMIAINGGAAITAIAKNGTTIFTAAGTAAYTVVLEPDDTITVTYPGAAVWGWWWTPIR